MNGEINRLNTPKILQIQDYHIEDTYRNCVVNCYMRSHLPTLFIRRAVKRGHDKTLSKLRVGLNSIYCESVACRQGTLTPPDTWSRPFGTCICSSC